MAEECISFSDTSDANRSWRRISTGKLNFIYSEQKVIPNYLKPSGGSCHDACKYGVRHGSEEKALGSALKRVATKSSRDKIPNQSSDSRTLSKKTSKPSSSLSNYDSDVKKKKKASTGVSYEGLASVRNKTYTKKMKKKTASPSDPRLGSSVMRKQKATQFCRKVFVPPGRAPLSYREIADLNERASTLSKLKYVTEKGSGLQHQEKNITKTRKNIGVCKADPKKAVLSERSSSVKAKQGKEHKDLVEEKTLYVIEMETGNANMEPAIDIPTNDPSVSSSPQRVSRGGKRQEEPESTVTEAEDESSENEGPERGEEDVDVDDDDDDECHHDGKEVPRQRKIIAFSSEDAVKDKAMKPRLKRGKIKEPAAPCGNNSPRRLKFKRGRALTGDDSNPKSGTWRSFKTKGNNLNSDEHYKTRSLKPSLRHHETQRKKDSRRLYNNVIKETARRLAETRKSKVKVLVGAFETVISLHQETKPSST